MLRSQSCPVFFAQQKSLSFIRMTATNSQTFQNRHQFPKPANIPKTGKNSQNQLKIPKTSWESQNQLTSSGLPNPARNGLRKPSENRGESRKNRGSTPPRIEQVSSNAYPKYKRPLRIEGESRRIERAPPPPPPQHTWLATLKYSSFDALFSFFLFFLFSAFFF